MESARHILEVLELSPMFLNATGATHFHLLPGNHGLVFYVTGDRHTGWVIVRRNDNQNTYIIRYRPSNSGSLKDQIDVREEDLADKIMEEVGESSTIMEYIAELYLIQSNNGTLIGKSVRS